MDHSAIGVTLRSIDGLQQTVDELATKAATDNSDMQVTRALLAASWGVRSAAFCMRLASELLQAKAATQPGEGGSRAARR